MLKGLLIFIIAVTLIGMLIYWAWDYIVAAAFFIGAMTFLGIGEKFLGPK